MAKSPKGKSIAEIRYARIKGLVSFKYTGTEWNKRKIKKYEQELQPLLSQPNTIYKSRSKKNLAIAAEGSGITIRLPGLKAVPVKTDGMMGAKVKIKKGLLIVEGEHVKIEIIPFSSRGLAKDPQGHVSKRIAPHVTEGASNRFQIQAGNFFIYKNYSAGQLPDKVARLMLKYDHGTKGAEKHNSTWRDWLHGARHLEAKNQMSLDEFVATGKADRAAAKKARKAAARKARNK